VKWPLNSQLLSQTRSDALACVSCPCQFVYRQQHSCGGLFSPMSFVRMLPCVWMLCGDVHHAAPAVLIQTQMYSLQLYPRVTTVFVQHQRMSSADKCCMGHRLLNVADF